MPTAEDDYCYSPCVDAPVTDFALCVPHRRPLSSPDRRPRMAMSGPQCLLRSSSTRHTERPAGSSASPEGGDDREQHQQTYAQFSRPVGSSACFAGLPNRPNSGRPCSKLRAQLQIDNHHNLWGA